MDLGTILGSRVNTSIDFNGLLVPANSAGHHIRKYTCPALFYTENSEPFSLSKSGSLTKIKHRGRYFVLATRHQVIGECYNLEQICLHNADRKTFVTSSRAYFPEGEQEAQEAFDCIMLEFTEAIEDRGLTKIGWYDIGRDLSRLATPKALACCCIGYPGFRNTIDYEAEHYAAAPNAVFGTECPPVVRGRLSFKPIKKISYDPRGMSGGPVFGFALENGSLIANLSGILTNASQVCFNFMPLQRIKSLVSLAFNDTAT